MRNAHKILQLSRYGIECMRVLEVLWSSDDFNATFLIRLLRFYCGKLSQATKSWFHQSYYSYTSCRLVCCIYKYVHFYNLMHLNKSKLSNMPCKFKLQYYDINEPYFII